MWPSKSVARDRMTNAVAGMELALSLIGACEGTHGGHGHSVLGTLPSLAEETMAGYGGHADSVVGVLPPLTESAMVDLRIRLDAMLDSIVCMPADDLATACARLRRIAVTLAGGARRGALLAEGPFMLIAIDLAEVGSVIRRIGPSLDSFQIEALDLLTFGPIGLAGQLYSASRSAA